MIYAQERSPSTARPKETDSMIGRLADFYGDMLLTELKGQTHREYVKDRENSGGARRDLEVLRAAINYYHAENTLDMVPRVTLPEKGTPRQTWLTRQDVAKLLRAARKGARSQHIVRLIMIGLYTGTRLSADLDLQWCRTRTVDRSTSTAALSIDVPRANVWSTTNGAHP
jgi:hypothetical protein